MPVIKKDGSERESFVKRTLLTTERGESRIGDVRLVDSDPHNLTLERFNGEGWKFSGYYTHIESACVAALDLAGAKGFPEAASALEAVQKCSQSLHDAIHAAGLAGRPKA